MPDDLASKVQTARSAGYSDDEILGHLAGMVDPSKIQTAQESGYSASDIVNHLAAGSGGQQPPHFGDTEAKQLIDTSLGGLPSGLAKAAANPAAPSEESAQNVIKTYGKTLPLLGGMAGSVAGSALRLNPVGSAISTGLGTGAADLAHSGIQTLSNDPDAPKSLKDAVQRAIDAGVAQGGMELGVVGGSSLLGKTMGSGRLPQAEATLSQLRRSNLPDNFLNYAEASNAAGPQVAENYLTKRTFLGNALQRARATDQREALDIARGITKRQVSEPFEQAVEQAGDKTFDGSGIVDAAKKSQQKILDERIDLDPAAQKLLNRALKLESGGPALGGGGMQLSDFPPEIQKQIIAQGGGGNSNVTPYQVRDFYSELSKNLRPNSTASHDVQRVSKDLISAVEEVDNQVLPPGTKENYATYKKDFGRGEGSISSKISKPTGKAGFISMLTAPVTEPAAGVSSLLNKVPLDKKIAFLKALQGGDAARVLTNMVRAGQGAYETGPYGKP